MTRFSVYTGEEMKVILLYNLRTPDERWATDLQTRLSAEQVEAELLDADSPRGAELAEHYDVMARPAILVIKEDGAPQQVWQGHDQMPQFSEIVYLVHT